MLGKPVVYFNPHGEKVDKFLNPMGAFEIARDASELVSCLERVKTKISLGVNFRQQADAFLKFHLTSENQLLEHLTKSEKSFEIELLRSFLLRNEFSFENTSSGNISLSKNSLLETICLKEICELPLSDHKLSDCYVYVEEEDEKLTFSSSEVARCNQRKVSLFHLFTYFGHPPQSLSDNIAEPNVENSSSGVRSRSYFLGSVKFTARKIIVVVIYSLRSLRLEKKFLRFVRRELRKY